MNILEIKSSLKEQLDYLSDEDLKSLWEFTQFLQYKKTVKFNKKLPFKVNIPNEITENTFKKTDQSEDLIKCENVEEMFNKLGI